MPLYFDVLVTFHIDLDLNAKFVKEAGQNSVSGAASRGGPLSDARFTKLSEDPKATSLSNASSCLSDYTLVRIN